MNFSVEVSNSYDGSLKVYINELQITTWASDMKDVKIAVEEAVECFKIIIEKKL